MTGPLSHDHPLHRLFSGTVQQVFYSDVGMCDPQIADYLADMLSQFIHMDDLYRFKNADGRTLENLAEMVTDAELGEDINRISRDRTIHQHIGDFALFWTGLFPEGLQRARRWTGCDRMVEYTEQGKRSYALASELTLHPDEEPPARVLQRLSDQFEYCMYGLHLCRKAWDNLTPQLPDE
jgi:hypothetical protein